MPVGPIFLIPTLHLAAPISKTTNRTRPAVVNPVRPVATGKRWSFASQTAKLGSRLSIAPVVRLVLPAPVVRPTVATNNVGRMGVAVLAVPAPSVMYANKVNVDVRAIARTKNVVTTAVAHCVVRVLTVRNVSTVFANVRRTVLALSVVQMVVVDRVELVPQEMCAKRVVVFVRQRVTANSVVPTIAAAPVDRALWGFPAKTTSVLKTVHPTVPANNVVMTGVAEAAVPVLSVHSAAHLGFVCRFVHPIVQGNPVVTTAVVDPAGAVG